MLPDLRIGEPIDLHLQGRPDLLSKFLLVESVRTELLLGESPPQYLDLHISPLNDAQHQPLGRLIVWRDITELKLLQLELSDQASRDAVTQVYNRRHFIELAHAELKRSIRLNQSFSIVIADLDRFKNVNDTYGHPAGDVVLHGFAQFCLHAKRKKDVFARWGGEEFIFMLPETGGREALEFTERLRRQVADSSTVVGPYSISITASLGVAALTGPQDTLEMLLSRADQALYAAKAAGRNRTVLWQDDWTPSGDSA
jgi:diguanylate cyclase (GGDEF)-like protein